MHPLPSGFVPTSDDCATTETESKELDFSYNVDYASCIGSLIYLSMTRTDIIYSVNKLAKDKRKPGKPYFEALRYLRDNSLLVVRCCSNILSIGRYSVSRLKRNTFYLDSPILPGTTIKIVGAVRDVLL